VHIHQTKSKIKAQLIDGRGGHQEKKTTHDSSPNGPQCNKCTNNDMFFKIQDQKVWRDLLQETRKILRHHYDPHGQKSISCVFDLHVQGLVFLA